MAITREKVFDKLQKLLDATSSQMIIEIIAVKLSTDELNDLIDDVAKDLDIEI